MALEPKICFRNMDPSPAIEDAIREKAERLTRFFPRLIGCRVMVEAPHRSHHKGNLFHVAVDLTLPGRELVVSRDPGRDEDHVDVYVAIRDAFAAAQRQLQDHARTLREHSKYQDVPPPPAIPPEAQAV